MQHQKSKSSMHPRLGKHFTKLFPLHEISAALLWSWPKTVYIASQRAHFPGKQIWKYRLVSALQNHYMFWTHLLIAFQQTVLRRFFLCIFHRVTLNHTKLKFPYNKLPSKKSNQIFFRKNKLLAVWTQFFQFCVCIRFSRPDQTLTISHTNRTKFLAWSWFD